jgi:hypothetical protein
MSITLASMVDGEFLRREWMSMAGDPNAAVRAAYDAETVRSMDCCTVSSKDCACTGPSEDSSC